MSLENASVDNGRTYLVIDLSEESKASDYFYRFTDDPPNIKDDTCRTTELWLRRIPAGTFIMGDSTALAESRKKEWHLLDAEETAHEVTLTEDFYLGIFPCTQKQYELIMGGNPSEFRGIPGRWKIFLSRNSAARFRMMGDSFRAVVSRIRVV